MRTHAADRPTLRRIAQEAGASPYHFSRMYHALTGETPFAYLARTRLALAARMVVDEPREPITDIALSVGYETPSAFNRAFKATLGLSPSGLRRLPSACRQRALDRLTDPQRRRSMKLDLSPEPKIEVRKDTPYLYVRVRGSFPEQAPQAWSELHRLLAVTDLINSGHQFVGACWDDGKHVAERDLRYDAGMILDALPKQVPAGMKAGTLPGGKYARFEYRGPYLNISHAFEQALVGWVAASGAKLRHAPSLELYLNDPEHTEPKDLRTALLLPIE